MTPELQQHLLVRLTPHLRMRRTEWIASAQCIIWGLVLLAPIDTFAGPAFAFFRFMPELVWGYIMLTIGLVRLAGLVINGARHTVTPWMRLGSAIVSCGIFTAVSLCFLAGGTLGVWIAAWPVAALTELFNISDTAYDARRSRGYRSSSSA